MIDRWSIFLAGTIRWYAFNEGSFNSMSSQEKTCYEIRIKLILLKTVGFSYYITGLFLGTHTLSGLIFISSFFLISIAIYHIGKKKYSRIIPERNENEISLYMRNINNLRIDS